MGAFLGSAVWSGVGVHGCSGVRRKGLGERGEVGTRWGAAVGCAAGHEVRLGSVIGVGVHAGSMQQAWQEESTRGFSFVILPWHTAQGADLREAVLERDDVQEGHGAILQLVGGLQAVGWGGWLVSCPPAQRDGKHGPGLSHQPRPPLNNRF